MGAVSQEPLRTEALRWPGAGQRHVPPPELLDSFRACCARNVPGADKAEEHVRQAGPYPEQSACSAYAGWAEKAAAGMAVRPGTGWLQALQLEGGKLRGRAPHGAAAGPLQKTLPHAARCALGRPPGLGVQHEAKAVAQGSEYSAPVTPFAPPHQ